MFISVDHTRVKLRDVDHNTPGAEYINANYIRTSIIDNETNYLSSSSESLNSLNLCQQCASQKRGLLHLQNLNKTKNPPINITNTSSCFNCNKRNNDLIGGGNSLASGNNRSCVVENDQFKTYIATQGCLQSTIIDFWNMIWQENTRVIVMTTKEIERGKNKCAKYWPDLKQTKEFGFAKITCTLESVKADYTLREFDFSWKEQKERKIYHFHFQVWPDHGVPSDPGCVLNFLQDVNARQNQLKTVGEQPVSLLISTISVYIFKDTFKTCARKRRSNYPFFKNYFFKNI